MEEAVVTIPVSGEQPVVVPEPAAPAIEPPKPTPEEAQAEYLFRMRQRVVAGELIERAPRRKPKRWTKAPLRGQRPQPEEEEEGLPTFVVVPIHRAKPRTERNKACRCGSGQKYKRCCGRIGAPICDIGPEDEQEGEVCHEPTIGADAGLQGRDGDVGEGAGTQRVPA